MDDADAVARIAVVSRLLAMCPHMKQRWQEVRTDDDEEPLAYIQAASLAEVVVEAFQAGDTECFKALFEEVEDVIGSGTSDQRELVIVGFLEDLQGALGWAGLELNAMERWLGPQARDSWIELIEMWAEIRRKKASGELPPGPFEGSQPEIKDPTLRRIFRQVNRPPERHVQ
jgi:hypothetical protein